jgi:protocatechuate 3,4-dioxygenase beta subunit
MKFILYFYKVLFCALVLIEGNAYAGEPPPPSSSLVGKVMVSYWNDEDSFECHFFKNENTLIFKDADEYSDNQYAWDPLGGSFYDYEFEESCELYFDTAYSGTFIHYQEEQPFRSGTFVLYNGLWDLDNDGTPDGEEIEDGTLPNLSAPPSSANFQSINGQVTDKYGRPVTGIEVTAHQYNPNSDSSYALAHTSSDENGRYMLKGLDPGQYRIRFGAGAGDSYAYNFAPQYYNNAPSLVLAQDVVLTEAGPLENINASLSEASKIIGTVTSKLDGKPIEKILVLAHRVLNNDQPDWSSWINFAFTESDGGYVLNLPEGTYVVSFYDYIENYYVNEYYSNQSNSQNAQRIILGANTTIPNINESLDKSARIKGTVKADDNASPLQGIAVSIHQYNAEDEWWPVVAYGETDSNGEYSISGFGAGNYRVEFRDYSGKYATECYDDTTDIDAAKDVVVAESAELSGINAELSKASSISGKVTGLGGVALTNVEIELAVLSDEGDWHWQADTKTDESGKYHLSGLRAGLYRIEFEDESGQYATEFYGDSIEFDSAANVNLGLEQNLTIDASLVLGSRIVGKVTGPDGKLLTDVWVDAIRLNSQGDWKWYEDAQVNENGTYQIGGLPNGIYRICFLDDDIEYSIQFHGDKSSTVYFDLAKQFTINTPQTIFGVNGQFNEKASAAIGAKLTDADGVSLSGVRIEAYRKDNEGVWRLVLFGDVEVDVDGFLGDDGHFNPRSLPAGTYRFKFEKDGYITKFYGDSIGLSDAQDFVVGDDQSVNGIDVILRKSAISQTIATFTSIANKTYGDAAFAVTAPTASSGLPVTMSVKSGPATISGNIVTLTGAGEVVLAANQAGNADYAAAAEVTIGFTVVLPPITSDLSDALVVKGKAINPYKVTTSFGANSYSVKKLPPGLKFNAKTGVISGKPKKPGTYRVVITASKKKGKKTLQKEAVVKVFIVS